MLITTRFPKQIQWHGMEFSTWQFKQPTVYPEVFNESNLFFLQIVKKLTIGENAFHQ